MQVAVVIPVLGLLERQEQFIFRMVALRQLLWPLFVLQGPFVAVHV